MNTSLSLSLSSLFLCLFMLVSDMIIDLKWQKIFNDKVLCGILSFE